MNAENRGLMGGAVGEKGKWVVGIEEGTCWDEPWVLSISDEPQESTPKTKSTLYTLYVSQVDNKFYSKQMETRGWRKIYHVKRKGSDTFVRQKSP